MIDKELVKSCYRALLGREPENDAIIEDKIRWLDSPEALIRDLLQSTEFQDRPIQRIADCYPMQHIAACYHSESARIDVDISVEQQKALFARLRNQWRALGEQDPFWSVLTHDEYRMANLDDKTAAEFYETGAEHARLVDLFGARNHVEVRRGTCVELGCGVGRVTKHLAAHFEKVIAVDISEGNLRQSQKMAEAAGIKNIEHVLLTSPDDIKHIDNFDVFYSFMVMQHNPPPIQKYQLDIILDKLNPGGVFLFQTQTYHPGYQFIIDEYLSSSVDKMDMHSLPMNEIFKIIDKHGHRIREVAVDNFTGRFGSYTFFGVAYP